MVKKFKISAGLVILGTGFWLGSALLGCSGFSEKVQPAPARAASTFAKPFEGVWTSTCLPAPSGAGTDRYEINIAEDGLMTVARYRFRSNRCNGIVSDLSYRAGRLLRLSPLSEDLFNVEVVLNPPHTNFDFMSGKLRVRLGEGVMQVAPVILLQQFRNSVLSREWRDLPGPAFYFTQVSPS